MIVKKSVQIGNYSLEFDGFKEALNLFQLWDLEIDQSFDNQKKDPPKWALKKD